ncbi:MULTISPECIES: phosphopantetheine-binding protein [Streptomyces]|uniref:Carrier domain-containing protein n=1 Tax=Streptomyces hyderabadensis TaxID=598549 RepID=A0ABP9HGH2_9ACTN|nr:phosphopantetheine-binding protein [Streptomyces hyderabadensis]
MWDEQFEQILRNYLPFLGTDEQLAADAELRDLGLDSLGKVELLNSMEDSYRVRFTEDALTPATFATPASLWGALEELRPRVA